MQGNGTGGSAAVQTMQVLSAVVGGSQDTLSPSLERSVRTVIDGVHLDANGTASGTSGTSSVGTLSVATTMFKVVGQVQVGSAERAALSGGPSSGRVLVATDVGVDA